ncbi:hypothetical protein H0H87_003326 [Tephrocybe sp. NHM501043]|nr:hypothetical protein H0H87_003326 [Tephrocybe sp. NHM501043]
MFGLHPPVTDHLSIITVIKMPIAHTESPLYCDFYDVDWEVFNGTFKKKLKSSPANLLTNRNDYNSLIITEHVPLCKLCAFTMCWWTPALSDLKKCWTKAEHAAYKYLDIHGHPSKEEAQHLPKELASAIKEAHTVH